MIKYLKSLQLTVYKNEMNEQKICKKNRNKKKKKKKRKNYDFEP